jgi:hypothetical protein
MSLLPPSLSIFSYTFSPSSNMVMFFISRIPAPSREALQRELVGFEYPFFHCYESVNGFL